MKIVHLMCGLPCSGKTTFAHKLAEERSALYLGLDELLITLYGQYPIDQVGHEEHVQRVIRCRRALWKIAMHALRVGMEVILDDGFFLKENRQRYASLSAAAHASSRLYYFDIPHPILFQRLEDRNARLPASNFPITAQRLEAFIHLFEIPTDDEGNERIVLSLSSL